MVWDTWTFNNDFDRQDAILAEVIPVAILPHPTCIRYITRASYRQQVYSLRLDIVKARPDSIVHIIGYFKW